MRPSTFLILFLVTTIRFTAVSAAAQVAAGSEPPPPLEGSVADFDIAPTDIALTRIAQPDTYFDKTGRRFAILGVESGSFEAWAWPIKLFRDFSLDFFIGSSTQGIHARDIVARIDVNPHVTTLTYVFQSFTVRAHFFVPVDEAGAVVLLDVDSTEPLTIVAGFIPTLMPMWPAGIGGQYASWSGSRRAYVISESSYRNHGLIGSPAAAGLSYTPAHMLSDQPNQFSIRIEDPEAVAGRFVPIVMAGGTGERSGVEAIYDRLAADPQAAFRETRAHYASLREETLRIDTPVDSLDLAFEWAKIAYDNLLVTNPHFEGTGLIAGLDRAGPGGRPGFGWFFGGDTYINTLSLNALGHFDASRTAIAFMTQFQREDGKMAHEVTQSVNYADWFEDYPYAYIHADTSPYFIVAVDDYYQSTGDAAFVREQFPAVRRAYEWSRQTDGNADGLMDNSLAGLGALEFGALTGIQSDIYLNAVWLKAQEAMSRLAAIAGDDALVESSRSEHERSLAAFEGYWSEAVGQYVYAFNEDSRLVEEITPWSAVGLMFGFGTDERARLSLQRMARADLTADWGVRMLSTESPYFEPLNYNYGAVWPFLTSWVTTAQFKRGMPMQAYSGLLATVGHVYNRSLGQVTEVMSGLRHTWPQESVPHQGFCTAGTVLPLVRGLLGLATEDGGRQLAVRPFLPGDWDRVRMENYRIGETRLDLTLERSATTLQLTVGVTGPGGQDLIFEPALSPGTSVGAVRVNGRAHAFDMNESSRRAAPSVLVTAQDGLVIALDLTPAFEILPPVWHSRVGDESDGLRIVDYTRTDGRATLSVQGRAGRSYRLEAMHAETVSSVSGARLEDGGLRIDLPADERGEYVDHTIELSFE